MKKIVLLLIVVTALLSACKKSEIDEAQLPGTWQTGTEMWKFLANGLGHTWDPADDVTEDEAQDFSWEVTDNKDEKILTITHYTEVGAVIPKTYTIVTLTSTTLELKDEVSGKTTTYTRVE